MPKSEGGYGKEKGEKVFYASANKGTIKGVHEDIEKFATADEKLFLEQFDDWDEVHGETIDLDPFAEVEDEEEEVEEDADEQNPTGGKWLRKMALRRKLGYKEDEYERELRQKTGSWWTGSSGATLMKPFDKQGNPRKYVKILLALEDNPGMTKAEIYRDVLGRTDLDAYQLKGQDTTSTWSPLGRAGLIEYDRKTKTYKLGPAWPEYKKRILGIYDDEEETSSEEVSELGDGLSL